MSDTHAIAQRSPSAHDAATNGSRLHRREVDGQALALIEAFQKRGSALDAAFDGVIEELQALELDFTALSLIGYAPATWSLARVNLALAAGTKLQRVSLQQIFLAPRSMSPKPEPREEPADHRNRRE